MNVAVFVAAACCLFGLASCQTDNCAYPEAGDIQEAISGVLRTGDAGSTIEVAVIRFQPLCLAHSQNQGFYRGVSVLVEYNCMTHSSCPDSPAVEQFEFGCEDEKWSDTVEGATSGQRTTSPSATFSTSLRQDCAFCLSTDSAGSVGAPSPDDTLRNCIFCDPACDEGLMRCYGNGDSNCCNFFNNSQCVDECPSPFQNNSDSVCVCPVGKTGYNCSEDVVCEDLVGTLGNGVVGYTDTVMVNSVAIHSCDKGFVLLGEHTRTCLVTGLWSDTDSTCAADCGVLDKPSNGNVSLSDGTIMGSVANYSCSAGYAIEGGATRTCQASGSWSGTAPLCEKACEVADCESCASDITKCDACSRGKAYDERSGKCISAIFQCEKCDDCGGPLVGIIVLVILLVIAVALAVALPLLVYFYPKIKNVLKKKKSRRVGGTK